jgi:60 kDa SS-A/Ro ribonucleoprotein
MRFNFSQKGRQPADNRYAYVKAGSANTQGDLFTTLLSGSLTSSPAGYESDDLTTLRREIRQSDADIVAKLAIHFGEGSNFRDLAFLLTAELAAINGNDEKTAQLVERIVRQPTDIPLWLAYYFRATKPTQRPGRAVRKTLNLLLNRLDEFQYSRCNRNTQLALRNALHLLRPKAADRTRKTLFSGILRDQLPPRSTWEQEWHDLYHQQYESPEQRQVILRDKWKEGISSFRIGYTALLDNLRPMLCAGVSGKVLKLAAEYLGNAAAVARSGTNSLRMLEVYRALRRMEQGGAGMLAEALEQAVLNSSWARSGFGSKGVSVIAMDVSNSMKRPVDGLSGVQRFDVAPLLAMSWKMRGNQLITGIIGNNWRPLELPAKPALLAVDEFRAHEGEAGYAINAWTVLQDLTRRQQVVDRVLIFTDYRLWDNRSFNQPAGTDLGRCWRQYRNQFAPQAKLYLFDLAGYGSRSLECLEDGVFLIAGWKERMIDILEAVDAGKELIETGANYSGNG